MEIKDIEANKGNVDIVAEVVSKDEPREFEKFGKKGSVCNAKLKDDSGEVKLTLWNDDIGGVEIGDKIHVQNGWCSEYQGEKQLSAGKFGKIEVVEKSQTEVFTNDPKMLAGEGMPGMKEEPKEGSEDVEEEVIE
jgi:replication factor A1